VTEDKVKKLKVMRFWLFGTFIIVFAAISIYIGMVAGSAWIEVFKAGFPIWGITGALCVIWYLGYSYWLSRK